MRRLSIGVDFGTESVRVLVLDVDSGLEIGTATAAYRHGVLDAELPVSGSTVQLSAGWALQDPSDYLHALAQALREVLNSVDASSVIGVGLDFTSCTMLPVLSDGTPLCTLDAHRSNPHAWVKLWKHHAAQQQATRFTDVARERGDEWIDRYGGRVSSEWLFPKILETLEGAPDVFADAAVFLEAADWIAWKLTGVRAMSACTAGYKSFWSRRDGFPSDSFFSAVDARLAGVVSSKLPESVVPVGRMVGTVSELAAEWTGLSAGIPVATPLIDAHASVPGAGVVGPGRMVLIMGTSICHMLLTESFRPVPGIAGAVDGGIVPGLVGYEAGQPSLGDTLTWAVRVLSGSRHRPSAADFRDLEEEAVKVQPGSNGLLALDWWNGNRSVLDDSTLSGVLAGLTLSTTPAEIYRALTESAAFGTRVILEEFETGIDEIQEFVACGGLPDRSRLLIRVFADVCGKPVRIAASCQTSALGAALYGAVAAGRERGGYETIGEAVGAADRLRPETIVPDPSSHAVYSALYQEFRRLHDALGREGGSLMRVLSKLRSEGRASAY
jgi:L-ribulokinase